MLYILPNRSVYLITMNETDKNLLHLLRHNARLSVSELAAELGVTRATARSRMEKLQASGEIVGFTTVMRGDVHEFPVRGITLVEIEGRGTQRIIRQLDGLPDVQAIHTTNGRWDLIVEVGAQSLERLDWVLNQIRMIDGVLNSETSLLLATARARRRIAAPEHE